MRPIPFAPGVIDGLPNNILWTEAMVRAHATSTIADPGSNVDVPTRDNSAKVGLLGCQSFEKETITNFSGTLDLTNVQDLVCVSILVDDKATLTVEGTDFKRTYPVSGSALWNKKSFLMFDVYIPPGKKYDLYLSYENTANLTNNPAYAGKTDVDGINIYLSKVSPPPPEEYVEGLKTADASITGLTDMAEELLAALETKINKDLATTEIDTDAVEKFVKDYGLKNDWLPDVITDKTAEVIAEAAEKLEKSIKEEGPKVITKLKEVALAEIALIDPKIAFESRFKYLPSKIAENQWTVGGANLKGRVVAGFSGGVEIGFEAGVAAGINGTCECKIKVNFARDIKISSLSPVGPVTNSGASTTIYATPNWAINRSDTIEIKAFIGITVGTVSGDTGQLARGQTTFTVP